MNKTLIGILLLIILGSFLVGCSSNIKSITGNTVSELNDPDKYTKIPLSDISSTLRKHTYNTNGVNVNYFVVKGSDSEIRTAFDACDVCGGYKGYRQSGSDVTCNNCNKVFRIDDIGTKNKPSGCWPSFLAHKIEGEYIYISNDELSKNTFRFR